MGSIGFDLTCFRCSVWVARKPPGFAFIDFDETRDAKDAIRELDGNMIIIFFSC
uniref:RRM domain-containing protein n=1 Tax=Aegilops tauschii subsp. strangulata TaxID=200361 RepID=A0A453P2I4_AEGTS